MILCAIIDGGGFLISCSKNEVTPSERINLCQNSDYELEKQIIEFSSTMKSSQKVATTEIMNFGDALWLLEASFNYNNCFNSDIPISTQNEFVYFPISFNNTDEISIAEIQTLFKTINTTLGDIYTDYAATNKGVLLINFELESTTAGNHIYTRMTMGSFSNQKSGTSTNTNRFGSYDYWFPGTLWHDVEHRLGKCNTLWQYKGVHDAKSKIEEAVYTYECAKSNSLYYFTSIFGRNAVNPYTGLFQGLSDDCISPNSMNNYYNAVVNKIVTTRNYYNIPSDKYLVDLDMETDGTFLNDGSTNYDGSARYTSIMYVQGFYFGTRKLRKTHPEEDQVPFNL